MNIDPFASVAAVRCQSKGCHRRGTGLAVDLDHPGDGIPEVYCRDCLRVLVGQLALRPATGAKATLWRVADELKAHHHAVASFLIAGLGLISGVQGVGAWVLLVAFTGSAVADVVALRQRTRQLWPLCLPPMLIGMVVAAAMLEPVSYVGIMTAAAYLYMLVADLCRGRVEASSVEAASDIDK